MVRAFAADKRREWLQPRDATPSGMCRPRLSQIGRNQRTLTAPSETRSTQHEGTVRHHGRMRKNPPASHPNQRQLNFIQVPLEFNSDLALEQSPQLQARTLRLAPDHSSPAHSGSTAQALSPLVPAPLESLTQEWMLLVASSDAAATETWISARCDDDGRASLGRLDHTARAYRREAHRFLLWLRVQRGADLAGARLEDCQAG